MGSRYELSCKNLLNNFPCVYTGSEEIQHTSISFDVGIGMGYSPERVFYGDQDQEAKIYRIVKSKTIIKDLRRILVDPVLIRSYGYSLYVCEECHKYYNRFYFHIQWHRNGQDGEYRPVYYCRECKKELSCLDVSDDGLIFQDTKAPYAFSCALCGSTEYNLRECLFWD